MGEEESPTESGASVIGRRSYEDVFEWTLTLDSPIQHTVERQATHQAEVAGWHERVHVAHKRQHGFLDYALECCRNVLIRARHVAFGPTPWSEDLLEHGRYPTGPPGHVVVEIAWFTSNQPSSFQCSSSHICG